MSFSQLARLIFYEGGSMLLGGCLLGLAGGILAQGLADNWAARVTDTQVHFQPAWQLGFRAVAVALVISIGAVDDRRAENGRLPAASRVSRPSSPSEPTFADPLLSKFCDVDEDDDSAACPARGRSPTESVRPPEEEHAGAGSPTTARGRAG